jgi:FtsH-binding integral membrane protein
MIAAGATAASTIGLTAYAITTKSDFSTFWSSFLGISQAKVGYISSFLCLTPFLMIFSFTLNTPILKVLAGLGFGLIYTVYLLYDTQRIVSNIKHKLSVDEFVLASIFLYVDIIGIFLHILRVIGRRSS